MKKSEQLNYLDTFLNNLILVNLKFPSFTVT